MADDNNDNDQRYYERVQLWRRLCTELYQEQVNERYRRQCELAWDIDHLVTTADDIATLFDQVAVNADLHFAGERLHELDDPRWLTVQQLWETTAFTPAPATLDHALAAIALAAMGQQPAPAPAPVPAAAPAVIPAITITVASPSPSPPPVSSSRRLVPVGRHLAAAFSAASPGPAAGYTSSAKAPRWSCCSPSGQHHSNQATQGVKQLNDDP